MEFSTATFYVFSAVLIFAALRVITTRNPVHAALWLVLCFFTAAGIWILLRATYVTLRDNGIDWRGTHYPLAALKANRV